MKYLLWFLPLALLLIGCSDDDKGTNPTISKEIWPLKVGNQWTYEHTELDSAGHALSVDTNVIEVVKDTIIQNERWYITTVNGVRDPEMSPGMNHSDGMWGWLGTSGVLVFKYPAKVNDTYIVGLDTVTVKSINESVTVTAGTFVCCKYWFRGSTSATFYQNYFLSPGVGWIEAAEYRREIGGGFYQQDHDVLISYTLH